MTNFVIRRRSVSGLGLFAGLLSLPFMKGTALSCLLLLWVASACRIHQNPPELTGVSPGLASVGQEVTLMGYQFGSDPVVTLGVGASAVTAAIRSHDNNTIKITVPRVVPGPTQIHVRTDEGTADPLPFTVQQPAPILTGINPGNGLPGTTVVLTGDYLNQLQRVRFDDVEAVVKDSSAQQLTVIVPPNLPRGPRSIVVETGGGPFGGGQYMGSFIVAGTPQITGITPLRTKPGAALTIRGVNLLDAVVRVNGKIPEKQLTTVTDTEIRTVVPAEATSGRVTVTVFEKLMAVSADSLQIVQPPALASLSARDGIVGDKIILTGRNLSEIANVSFGSVAVAFRILSDAQIEATVPALPQSGPVGISVSSTGGSATATDPFFFYLAPSGLTVSPERQLRGRSITISGQNLYRITDVRVSGHSVPITSRNEGTDLLVDVPADAVTGPVTVVSRAGTATTVRPLIVVQKPVVTDLIPPKARPGERVVIRGDFLLNAQIFFAGTNTPAADGGKNEDTERWVLVPADAQTGPLRIVNATNEATLTDAFTVLRVVVIADFSPKSAKVGDEILITGSNLALVQEVRFNNGTLAAPKFAVSENAVRVTVPTGVITGQICLVNAAGTICTTSNFTVAK